MTFYQYLRFCAAVGRYCRPGPAQARNVTRLWNYADHQSEPEPLWRKLQSAAPEMFASASPNSVAFTYPRAVS